MRLTTYTPATATQLAAVLDQAKVPWEDRGSHFVAKCPFHNDTNPSLTIENGSRHEAGLFKCFGCNATGHFGKLCQKLGVDDPRPMGRSLRVKASTSMLGTSKRPFFDLDGMGDPWPADEEWRGLPGKLLRSAGCVKGADGVIYFPCAYPSWQGGGYANVARWAVDADLGKHIYKSGQGADLKACLWPFGLVERILSTVKRGHHQELYITEGYRDALRMIQYGGLALAVCGAAPSVHYRKCSIITTLCTAYDLTPVVCMDSDGPGEEANDKAIKLLRPMLPKRLAPKVIRLSRKAKPGEKLDLGNVPEAVIRKLARPRG